MRTYDIETIIICAVAAIAGSLGMIAGGAAFAGVRFSECNPVLLTGTCCTLGGVLWGILLILNCKNLQKHE